MVESDTIKLLRECDAGIKMGVKSIDDVLDKVKNVNLKNILNKCKDEHHNVDKNLQSLLNSYQDQGKDPSIISETMAEIKTEVKMQMDKSDKTIAELMTDGCNMGVKSLNKYLNQYVAADEKSKDIAKKIIDLESNLAIDLRTYL